MVAEVNSLIVQSLKTKVWDQTWGLLYSTGLEFRSISEVLGCKLIRTRVCPPRAEPKPAKLRRSQEWERRSISHPFYLWLKFCLWPWSSKLWRLLVSFEWSSQLEMGSFIHGWKLNRWRGRICLVVKRLAGINKEHGSRGQTTCVWTPIIIYQL